MRIVKIDAQKAARSTWKGKAGRESWYTIGAAKSISFVSGFDSSLSTISFLHSPVLHLVEIALNSRYVRRSLAELQGQFSAKELVAMEGRWRAYWGFWSFDCDCCWSMAS